MENADPPRFQYRSEGGKLPRHSFEPTSEGPDPFFSKDSSDMFSDFDDSPLRRSFMDLRGHRPRFFDDDPFFSGGGFNRGPSPFSGNDSPFSRFSSQMPSFHSEQMAFNRPATDQQQQTMGHYGPRSQHQESKQHQQQDSQERPPGLHRSYTQPSNGPFFHQRSTSEAARDDNDSQQRKRNEGQNVRVIPVQRQQSSGSNTNKQKPGTFVEVNSAPNSYTNGQLNPDKRMRYNQPSGEDEACNNSPKGQKCSSNSFKEPPVIIVDDYSHRKCSNASPRGVPHSPAISEHAIPLPPPPEYSNKSTSLESSSPEGQKENVWDDGKEETMAEEKPMELAGEEQQKEVQDRSEPELKEQDKAVPLLYLSGEQLIKALDGAELRVEQLRDSVAQLEQEKETLLVILNGIGPNGEGLGLPKSELEELCLATDRVINRCKTVNVSVNTPRNEDQEKALEEVNSLIQTIIMRLEEDPQKAKDALGRYLNACSPDEPTGPIDQRFQTKVH